MTAPAGAADSPSGFLDPIEGLIPSGSICTLSGASGVGKTAFLATLIRDLLLGLPLFGHPSNIPPQIGILVCDRPWRDHAAWFAKAQCPDLPHLSLRDIDFNWDLLKDIKKIPALFGTLIDKLALAPGSLLIVDPLPLFIPGRLIDYKDMAIGFGHLDAQLKSRQLTMLGVFHVAKQKADKNSRYTRPQDRILGSTALIGYSETAFYLLSPDEADQKTYEFGAIAHQLPPITLQYRRDASGLFVPAHELDHQEGDETALAAFPATGQTVAAAVALQLISKAIGCSDRGAYRYLRSLLSDGRILRVGRGLYERAKPS